MSEWGLQMSGNGSHVLVWHSSRRQIPLVEKFIYKTVHRVLLSLVPYKCYLHNFFPLSSGLEKIGMSAFPVLLLVLYCGCCALKMLQRSKQKLCFLLRVKVWQGVWYCSALLLCWAIASPLWYLAVCSTAMTMLFGCCPEQWFQGHY